MDAILLIANQPDRSGNAYTPETLQAMADGKTRFWVEEQQALVYRGPGPVPEIRVERWPWPFQPIGPVHMA